MDCEQVSASLDAYIDQELEPGPASELAGHARDCPRCAAAVAERQRLRSALAGGMSYHPAPRETARSIQESLRPPTLAPRRARAPGWAWGSLAASLVMAGMVIWSLVAPMRRGLADEVVRDAVSSHIRSLMGSHLADIAVSDQHTVKPWFAGKVEFSPRVTDFASEGFPLVGGRLDYVAGRSAAAVIYTRHAHVINLLSCLDPDAKPSAPRTFTDRGYQAVAWTERGMRFCAVSDLNAEELMTFAELVRSPKKENP
jgi:anti-sigma factor RsiW